MLSKLLKQAENELSQERQERENKHKEAEIKSDQNMKEMEILRKMTNAEQRTYMENKFKQEEEQRKEQRKEELNLIHKTNKVVENEIEVFMNNTDPSAKDMYDQKRFITNLKCINRARCSLLHDNFKVLLDMLKKQSDEAALKEITYINLLPVHGELTHYTELVKMLSIINKQIEDYKALLQCIPFKCEKIDPLPILPVRRTKE